MNNQKKIIFSFLVITVVLLIAGYFLYQIQLRQNIAGVTSDISHSPVAGLVIPHHDVASHLIDQGISDITGRTNPQVIVILSPNHYVPESNTLITTLKMDGYPIHEKYINSLITNLPEIKSQKDVLEKEHGVIVPMNHLIRFFPDALFIPIIVSPYFKNSVLENTSVYLTRTLPSDTLYVLAIDFSHNSLPQDGLSYNDQSIAAISTFDYPEILDFKDDHLDSPVATILFLKIMDRLQYRTWTTVVSSHSSFILDNINSQGTSYVIGTFSRP